MNRKELFKEQKASKAEDKIKENGREEEEKEEINL